VPTYAVVLTVVGVIVSLSVIVSLLAGKSIARGTKILDGIEEHYATNNANRSNRRSVLPDRTKRKRASR
jgi:hypothetical protein